MAARLCGVSGPFTTTPARGRPRRRNASIDNSVWLMVPSVERATMSTGRWSSVAEGYEHAPGALDHQEALRGRWLEFRHVDANTGAPCGLMWCDRLWQHIGFGKDALVVDLGEPAHGHGVGFWLDPGLHRLPITCIEMAEQPRGDDGLADIGIGACDEKALQSHSSKVGVGG
jgi:hypothetical protein